jgi:hypothetical protein
MNSIYRFGATALIVGSAMACANIAQAITIAPPTPLTVDALTVNGPSVSYNFKTGDWHEFTFTVGAGQTDDLSAGNAHDNLTIENFTGTGTFISGPTEHDVPFSLAYTAGSYDVYIELTSDPDPDNSISLTGVSTTPLPATLPLFAGGLGFVGYLARRRKQSGKQALVAA